jgi:transcriptional regulator with XRE-family HTH domain
MPRPNPVKAHAILRGEYLRDVAAAVGVAPRTLSLVARGEVRSWPALRRRLADYFGLPEADLFPEDVDEVAS